MLPTALALTAIAGSSAASSAILLAAPSASADSTALFATVGGIIVAVITSTGAVLAVRTGHPTGGPGDAVAGLLQAAQVRIDELHDELDAARDDTRTWQSRAEHAGWHPGA